MDTEDSQSPDLEEPTTVIVLPEAQLQFLDGENKPNKNSLTMLDQIFIQKAKHLVTIVGPKQQPVNPIDSPVNFSSARSPTARS